VGMALQRLQRLFSHTASVPWILFLWSAAEVLERVEFIAEKGHRIREAAMTTSGSLMVLAISVIALIVVVLWPNIKPRFPSIPKGIHEKVREFEAIHIPHCERKHTDLGTRMDSAESSIRSIKEQLAAIGEGNKIHSMLHDKFLDLREDLVKLDATKRLLWIETNLRPIIEALNHFPVMRSTLEHHGEVLKTLSKRIEELEVAITPQSGKP
jgi:hypothetical protein